MSGLKQIHIRLSAEQLKLLAKLEKKTGMNRTTLIRVAISNLPRIVHAITGEGGDEGMS